MSKRKMHPIIRSIKSKQLLFSSLREALKKEQYELCQELVEFSRELGISKTDITDILEDSLEEERSSAA